MIVSIIANRLIAASRDGALIVVVGAGIGQQSNPNWGGFCQVNGFRRCSVKLVLEQGAGNGSVEQRKTTGRSETHALA